MTFLHSASRYVSVVPTAFPAPGDRSLQDSDALKSRTVRPQVVNFSDCNGVSAPEIPTWPPPNWPGAWQLCSLVGQILNPEERSRPGRLHSGNRCPSIIVTFQQPTNRAEPDLAPFFANSSVQRRVPRRSSCDSLRSIKDRRHHCLVGIFTRSKAGTLSAPSQHPPS
jgi:hypothetical protein